MIAHYLLVFRDSRHCPKWYKSIKQHTHVAYLQSRNLVQEGAAKRAALSRLKEQEGQLISELKNLEAHAHACFQVSLQQNIMFLDAPA